MRRLLALSAAALLLLSACADTQREELSEPDVFDATGTTPLPSAAPTSTPGVGGPSVGPDADPGRGRPAGTVGPRPRGGGASGGESRPSATSADPRRAHGENGSFAAVLLREDLTVEVLAQSGARPSDASYAHLISHLSEVAGRSVATSGPINLEGGAQDWTAQEVIATADARAVRPSGSATLRAVFLRGTYEGSSRILGVALRGDVMAIFIDNVRRTGGLVGDSAGVERSVMVHEAGHQLGLVDLYLDTGRADKQHPGHSSNKESVMYWAVETDAITSVFGANPPDTFDDADRADLARIKSGN